MLVRGEHITGFRIQAGEEMVEGGIDHGR
jgi:hypothetical protein